MIKFIVDAQLPYRLKRWITEQGYDTIHTLDLPLKSLTADITIAELALLENRIVISKDTDFLKLNILHQKPEKLLMLSTGNIVNSSLIDLFQRNFLFIIQLFEKQATIVEMNNEMIIIHQQ
jgi:predicted nuclease of predicted toxin-antitoxin system